MDTKDQDPQISSPGAMYPDTTMLPSEPQVLDMAHATPTTVAVIDESVPAALVGRQEESKPSTPLRDSFKRLWRDKRAMASVGVVVFFILFALLGPLIYQHIGGTYMSPTLGVVIGPTTYHNPFFQELSAQDQFISARHWLGTDSLGRDQLARLMQGVLVSLAVATMVEIADIVLGVLVGVLAGYYGGWIDQLLARFTDIMFAFPGILFAILLAGIFGNWADTNLSKIPIIGPNGNARLILVSFALAITAWPLMARYVRGQALQLKEQQFVEAARTSGTSNTKIIIRHIVPNLFSIVIVAATLDISSTVIGEAGLSLLGLGVQAPGSSIGLMITDGTATINTYPWEVLLPSIVLAIIVLAFSFLGDGLRDAFDPRSKD